MNLAIFDIDGTLTDTNAVDEACFVEAVSGTLGIERVSSDWSDYSQCVDSTILREIMQAADRDTEDPVWYSRFVAHFALLLHQTYDRDPSLFAPVRGADAVLRDLASNEGWAVALATGGYRTTASFKLERAGLGWAMEFPGAFADDVWTRDALVRNAWDRALECHNVAQFERVVSIGDGLWDVRAARELNLPFIGIGAGDRAWRLREAGTTWVFADYTDLPAVRAALANAACPA